ncbi:MAG TPA: SH3 domain-containing protein [Thermomicrobiales bacterium]
MRHPCSFSRRPAAILAVLLVAALGLGVAGLSHATAAPGADWSRLIVGAAPGDSRVEPVPLNQEGQAGPWKLTVLEVVTGDQATQQVTAASQFNQSPADGFTYVAVRLRAINTGDQPLDIDGNDFAVTGSSGLVRRFVAAVPPDPALDGVVAPGDTKEGWIVGGAASDEKDLLLLYDSVTLTGNWADRVFALQDGATVADVAARSVKLNKTGRKPDAPAGLNDVMATRDWAIEVLQVATGQDVYDLYPSSDYRTTALADSQNGADIPYWVAFKVKVTNNRTGGAPAYLPPTAFMLADPDGKPVSDVLTLTPPDPDAAGAYYPGASREGWVAFEQPTDYPGALIRFLPYQTDADPRYFTWNADAETAAGQPTATSGPIGAGTTVVVTDDGVRMRAQPSTSAEIVEELAQGTELTVTGPSGQADGLTWFPVADPATGKAGFVAADYLRAKT